MDPQLTNLIVTGVVGLVGPVVGWLLRHYTMPPVPPAPVAQPVQPVVAQHPVLSAFERVIEDVLNQSVRQVLAQGVSQVTVGVPGMPPPAAPKG